MGGWRRAVFEEAGGEQRLTEWQGLAVWQTVAGAVSVSAEGGRVESSQGTRQNSLMRAVFESRRELPREVPSTRPCDVGPIGSRHEPLAGWQSIRSEGAQRVVGTARVKEPETTCNILRN